MDKKDDLLQFERFLQRRSPDRRTPKDYLSDIRQFMRFCSKPWRDVSLHDIDAFVDHERQRGLKPATIKRRAAALKTFFDFLAEETGELSWPNPVRMKRHAGKQPRPLPRDLSNEALAQLWGVIHHRRDQAWFALMLRAGLRVGEVVGLKLDDLLAPPQADQPARLRVRGKGQKERVVLLTRDAYEVLQAWLQERPPSQLPQIFLNEREGRPLSVSGVEYRLRQYAQQAGLVVTPHQLRHTYARQATEAGMPLTSLGKLLGHAQVSTTQIYTSGADPQLCQAYQQAMGRLEQLECPAELAAPVPADPPVAPAVPAPLPPDPDWEQWAPHLPAALRAACLAYVQRRLPNWKPQHRRERALHVLGELRRFLEWQQSVRPIQTWSELRLADLQAFQTARSQQHKASETINKPLSYLGSLLKELVDQGQGVEASLFRLRALPKPSPLPRHLSEVEAQQLEAFVRARLETTDPTQRLENACYCLLAHTGLRASECVDLCAGDLDLGGGRVIVRQGKGGKDRVVYLSETARDALGRYLAGQAHPPTAPLLTRPDGQAIGYRGLLHHLAQIGQAAGVAQVTPHRLRHTLATRLMNAGMEITRLQKLLGHEHLDTTLVYARVYDQTVENDYRKAMQEIERQFMPLSDTPLAALDWPKTPDMVIDVQQTLENSV